MMPLQANYCIQLMMMFYAEIDQRSGWADRSKIVKYQKEQGVAEGRTDSAINSLLALKMLDQRQTSSGLELKISQYGIDWFERHFDLIERGKDAYHYEYSPFRKVRLVPPEVFYGNKNARPDLGSGINWTKWGAIFAALGVLVALVALAR